VKRTLTVILSSIFLLLAAAAAAHAQTAAEAAHSELVEGARAYRDRDFVAAEKHFRRALELDPTHKNTLLFIGRAVQQQYMPGVKTPENMATGERAIAAYREVLARDPRDDDAYKAIIFLYTQMKREDKVSEMLRQRAEDAEISEGQRAEALVILASRQWQCSYDVTERKANKWVESKPDRLLTHYRMPADRADFVRAQGCADEGLRLAERALALDPGSVNGWSYKAVLLREKAKLAEMGGNAARKNEYNRRYQEALDKQKHLKDEEEQRRGAKRQDDSTASAGPHG
jgi:tetratricopeptide (TPR) repeat protein